MTAPSAAVIQGVVTDDAGRPLDEVAVAVESAPGPVQEIAALTGPDGRFAISAPVLGSYTIVATAPDSRVGRVTVELDAARSRGRDVEIRVSHRA
ncbi:MAG: carboxypeptidase-like regulatory domain-containing protein [Ilumatobacteraceae bacterium]